MSFGLGSYGTGTNRPGYHVMTPKSPKIAPVRRLLLSTTTTTINSD